MNYMYVYTLILNVIKYNFKCQMVSSTITFKSNYTNAYSNTHAFIYFRLYKFMT